MSSPSKLFHKNDIESSLPSKASEQEVTYIREFTDVGSVARSTLDNVSPANEFHSPMLHTSIRDVQLDLELKSPSATADSSYINSSIFGVEDLIQGCTNLRITNEYEDLSSTFYDDHEESQNCTLILANENDLDVTRNVCDDDFTKMEEDDLTKVEENDLTKVEENDLTKVEENDLTKVEENDLTKVEENDFTIVEESSASRAVRSASSLSDLEEMDLNNTKDSLERSGDQNVQLEFDRNSDCFVSATSEIFQDPASFDFLLARSTSGNTDRLRAESLYVKFDPLISNVSMLPKDNVQPIDEEASEKSELSLSKIETPKRNPAIAAIDRLLFFSPMSTSTVAKLDETRGKTDEFTQKSTPDIIPISDVNITEELELVKTSLLRLEEELQKQKREHEIELEKQKIAFEERISNLQTTVAEYEKSISRLFTENEKNCTNFQQEREKLKQELQTTSHHLNNTEAAFNDVHSKYEKLKSAISTFQVNEAQLKESIQENLETIKSLENKYDQLKTHATTQLQKANLELVDIRKQHEAETVKLHAMIRKAELKCNSLTELIDQKTKENKELTQILDEVIARVGYQNAS